VEGEGGFTVETNSDYQSKAMAGLVVYRVQNGKEKEKKGEAMAKMSIDLNLAQNNSPNK